MTQDKNTPADLLQRLSDAYAEINKLVSLDSKGAVPEKWFAILSTIADAKGAIIDGHPTTPPPVLEGVEEELRALLEVSAGAPWQMFDRNCVIEVQAGERTQKANGKPRTIVHWSGFDACDYPLKDQRTHAALIVAMRNHLPALLSALAGMREALDRYRYAIAWTGADSWDHCSECRCRLEWARALDADEGRLSTDQMAAIGKTYAGSPEVAIAQHAKMTLQDLQQAVLEAASWAVHDASIPSDEDTGRNLERRTIIAREVDAAIISAFTPVPVVTVEQKKE